MSDHADDGLYVKIGFDSSAVESGFQKATELLEGALGNMSKGLESWGLSTEKFTEEGEAQLQKWGINIDHLAGKLGMNSEMMIGWAALGVAVYEVGEKLFELGKEYDEAMSNMGKSTGATGLSLRAMGDDLRTVMGMGVVQNLNDVAAGMALLQQRTDVSGDALIDLTKQMATFADVNKTTVQSSVDGLTTVMNKWNISVEDTPRLLDQLTRASQMSGVSTQQLTQQLTTGGAQFQELGMSLTDATALLAAFGKDGVNTSTVLVGLRTAVNTFTKENVDAKTGLEETLKAIKDSTDATEALSIANHTFGTRAGPELSQAIRSGKVDIDAFTESLASANGTVNETAEGASSLGDQWTEFMNKIGSALAPLGQVLIGIGKLLITAVADAFQVVMDVAQPTIDWLLKAFNSIQDTVSAVFGFVGAMVHGNWTNAWKEAQLIVLQVVKAVTDVFDLMVNTVIGVINGLTANMRDVLAKVGIVVPQIKTIVTSEALGIDKAIKDLNASIAAGAEETAKKLGTTNKKASDDKKNRDKNDATTHLAVQEDTFQKELDAEADAKEAQFKVNEDYWKQVDAGNKALVAQESEWSGKVRDQKLADLETQRKAVIANASKIGQSEKDLAVALQQLDSDTLATYQQKLDDEKQAALDKAQAVKDAALDQTTAEQEYAKTTAAINKYYDTAIANYKRKMRDDEVVQTQAQVKEQTTAWSNYYDSLVKTASDWSKQLVSLQDGFLKIAKTGLADIGKSLVSGKSEWSNFGAAAVSALADVVRGLGEQLVAMSLVHLLMGDFVGAALAAAGAAAAFVAGGALDAVSSQMSQAANSTQQATQALQDNTQALQDNATAAAKVPSKLSQAVVSASADVPAMMLKALQDGSSASTFSQQLTNYMVNAVGTAVKNSTNAGGYLDNAITSQVTDLMNSVITNNGAWQSTAFLSTITRTDPSMSLEDKAHTVAVNVQKAYLAAANTMGASVSAITKAFNDAMKPMWDNMEYTAATYGTTIGSSLSTGMVDAIKKGTSNADFTASMMTMLKQAATQAALLAGGFQDKFTALGAQIATTMFTKMGQTAVGGGGIAIADTTANANALASIKSQISTLYNQAQTAVSGINDLFSNVPAYANGTNNARGGVALVGEQGPELVRLPGGSSVSTASQTATDLSHGGRQVNIPITIQGDATADALRTARQLQQTMQGLAFQGAF
jgi:TP901 family phage tail tape measure protein